MVRIDRETRTPAQPAFEAAAREFLQARLPRVHALVLSDYAKGVLTPAVLKELIAQGRGRGYPVVVDPKGADYSLYAGATVITPNRKEAELAVGCSLARREDLVRAGDSLRESLGLDYLLITLGAEGMLLFAGGEPALAIPTRAREVFDVSGAGDTVAALMALGLAQWGDPVLAATLANVGAGVVVGKVGTAPVYRAELSRELGREGTRLEEKIRHASRAKAADLPAPDPGEKGGIHQRLFRPAPRRPHQIPGSGPALGDALVVAVDSDESVRQVKGEGRPVIGEEQRVRILAALAAVDYVTVFTSAQLPELLAGLRPDILTKGSNYPEAQVAGREIVPGYGGQVVLVPVTDPVSVSDLIRRIRREV